MTAVWYWVMVDWHWAIILGATLAVAALIALICAKPDVIGDLIEGAIDGFFP